MTEIEQIRKNLIQTWEVYFNHILPQKMAHTKHSIKQRTQKEVAMLVKGGFLGKSIVLGS